MKTIFNILDKKSPNSIIIISALLSGTITAMGYTFNIALYLEPFLVFPILFASWYGSTKSGAMLSFFSIGIFVFSNSQITDCALCFYVAHLLAYIFLAVLITNFRSVYRVEAFAANSDNLTKLLNSRSFYDELANEINRNERYKHVFSLAYLDVDNFKQVNDLLGHNIGDKLLIEVARCLNTSLCSTDKIARLGGDEYACLLPETGAEDAKKVFNDIENILHKSMAKYKWNVGFSIGVVTFLKTPNNVQYAILLADTLMYSVKNNKKNSTAYQIWDGNIK